MVGTTRSRVSHFMNKFKKLGFIDYTNTGDLTVNNGLLSVVLHDQNRSQKHLSMIFMQPSRTMPKKFPM